MSDVSVNKSPKHQAAEGAIQIEEELHVELDSLEETKLAGLDDPKAMDETLDEAGPKE